MEKYKISSNKLQINLSAVAANYELLKKFVGKKVTCAANVKSDAYGLGLEKLIPCLSKAGCNKFFVRNLEEALAIRCSSLTDEIYVLNGIASGEEEYFAQNNIVPVLNTKGQFELYNNYSRRKGKSFAAVLNIDTGINMIGFSHKEALALAKSDYFKQKLVIRFIMSYFASNSLANNSYNQKQLEIMQEVKQAFALPVSFSGSTGISLGANYHFDIVRPGLSLFGCANIPGLDLENAITLTSKIIQIKEVQEDYISDFENSYRLKKSSLVATIPIGYGDGILFSLSNKGVFDINGYKAPVIGKISMDLIMLDVTNIPKEELYVGAEVELLGRESTIQKIAEQAGTTYNNIITSLSSRIQRIYR